MQQYYLDFERKIITTVSHDGFNLLIVIVNLKEKGIIDKEKKKKKGSFKNIIFIKYHGVPISFSC